MTYRLDQLCKLPRRLTPELEDTCTVEFALGYNICHDDCAAVEVVVDEGKLEDIIDQFIQQNKRAYGWEIGTSSNKSDSTLLAHLIAARLPEILGKRNEEKT